jgi:hypothetical protein
MFGRSHIEPKIPFLSNGSPTLKYILNLSMHGATHSLPHTSWRCAKLSLSLSLSLSPVAPTLEQRATVKLFVSLNFLNYKTDGRTLGWGISPSQGCFLHRTTQTQNKRRQTSISWVGFEPTIPVFERAKTVLTLYRAATMSGLIKYRDTFILPACHFPSLRSEYSPLHFILKQPQSVLFPCYKRPSFTPI